MGIGIYIYAKLKFTVYQKRIRSASRLVVKNQKMFVGCFSLGKGWGIAQQSTNISSLCIKKPEGTHVLNWGVGGGGVLCG